MARDKLYPMLLAPIFKEKIWGGRKMKRLLNKKLPRGRLIGESWELSAHGDDITHVLNGPLAGTRLDKILSRWPKDLLGRTSAPPESFPLLTKFIDSSQLLSLQVHPPDSYAQVHDGENGKTECWYVVHAEPGAVVLRGLSPGTSPEMFRKALENGPEAGSLVRTVNISTGDFIFMPTGVVHAVGRGSIILEIEQNSDMTYRLYDWGRVGGDGKPRPLHIDKALEVIRFDDDSPDKIEGLVRFEGGNKITHLMSCHYFSVELLELESTFLENTGKRHFVVLTVVEGSAVVSAQSGEQVGVQKGDTVLLPARPPQSSIIPGRGCKIVKAYPDPTHKTFIQPLLQKGVDMEIIQKHLFR